jgi:hypothetical protein
MVSSEQPATISNSAKMVDKPNVLLAPEEIATLVALMDKYDQLLVDMDDLNLQIETLLKAESPASPVPTQQ